MKVNSISDAAWNRKPSFIHSVLGTAILVTFSGCAMIRSGNYDARVNPDNPREEYVTNRKCSPRGVPFSDSETVYPYSITADGFRSIYNGISTDNRPERLPRWMQWTLLAPAWLAIGGSIDTILLPATLPYAVFTSDCKEETITRANPKYHDIPKPKSPPQLSTEVAFAEPSGENVLKAGETGALRVKVSNAGPGTAYSILIIPNVSNQKGLTITPEVAVGDLPAGRSTTKEISLGASDSIETREVEVTLGVKEANGFDAAPTLVKFHTRAFRAPKLEVADISLGGSGVVKAGELTHVSATVRNTGSGVAEDVVASLQLGSSDIFPSGESMDKLGTILPGASVEADFDFFINNRYGGKKVLPVSIAVTEAKGKYGIDSQSLGLVMGAGAPELKVVTVAGEKPEPVYTPQSSEEKENVDIPPRSLVPLNPDAYAVIIGIEKYRQQDIPPVQYAARDAQTIYAYATRAMGFDAKNVILLQNERAGKSDLEKYLGSWLKNRVSRKSRVFIYYAGHGAPNPKTNQGFLVPYDGDPNYTEDTAYPIKRLYATLAKLPTKNVTVVLDSCFSGAGARSLIAQGARPLMTAVKSDEVGPAVVISATSGNQISTFFPDGKHGLLTYFLLKGLKGAADTDHRGRITTAELFAYMEPNVEREALKQNVEQTPSIIPVPSALGDRGDRIWVRTR